MVRTRSCIAEGAHAGLDLIKGGGGALLREKIVASASKEFIVVADSTKLVKMLGKFPLPVEVIQMALPLVEPKLAALGFTPKLRQAKDGSEPFVTDEGNYILDCWSRGIAEPESTAAEIRSIVGVVEHGLFLGMATLALVAGGGWRDRIPRLGFQQSHISKSRPIRQAQGKLWGTRRIAGRVRGVR